MIYYSEQSISYGKVLREARLQAGLTQRELAKALGYTRQFISKFETGARYPWTSARSRINLFFNQKLEDQV